MLAFHLSIPFGFNPPWGGYGGWKGRCGSCTWSHGRATVAAATAAATIYASVILGITEIVPEKEMQQGHAAQVVNLVGLDHLAGGFHSQKLGRQFEGRVSRYAKSCCCNTWEWRYPRMAYSLNATDLGRYTDPFGWGEGAASIESRKM